MSLPLPPFERYRLELRLAKPVTLPFEHGGVLRGLISRALGRHRLPPGLLPFACESGRVRFDAGDVYAIGLTLAGEARGLAGDLTAGLERLEVVLEAAGGEQREIPIAALSHLVFVGRVRATVPVLRGLAGKGIPSFFCRADGSLEAVFGPFDPLERGFREIPGNGSGSRWGSGDYEGRGASVKGRSRH